MPTKKKNNLKLKDKGEKRPYRKAGKTTMLSNLYSNERPKGQIKTGGTQNNM